jgi:hypothetical protein
MALSQNYRNSLLDRGFAANSTANVLTVKLHTGDPGTTGLTEVSGGGYAAQAATFGAASAAAKQNTGPIAFNIPAATTVAWVSLWDGATFVDKADVADEAYAGAGTYTLPTSSITVSLL